jgi:type I restriction enzyme M protein
LGKAVLDTRSDRDLLPAAATESMRAVGRHYPGCGWGQRFRRWLNSPDPRPYGSYGNGAAMRVSACAIAAGDLEEAVKLSNLVTGVTHDHPEGLKGAEAVAAAMFWAKSGLSLAEIRSLVVARYYPLDFTIDAIRPTYRFNETCQDTVPQALAAFLESSSFEDAIRTAVSVGGDSDTLAAITGSVAEAFYGVPEELREKARGSSTTASGGSWPTSKASGPRPVPAPARQPAEGRGSRRGRLATRPRRRIACGCGRL